MGTGRAGGRLRRDGTIWPGRRGDASRVAAARLGGGRAGKRAGGLGAAVVVVEVVVVVNVKRSRGPEGAEDEEGRGRGGTRGREKGLRSWLRGEGEGERIVVVNKKKTTGWASCRSLLGGELHHRMGWAEGRFFPLNCWRCRACACLWTFCPYSAGRAETLRPGTVGAWILGEILGWKGGVLQLAAAGEGGASPRRLQSPHCQQRRARGLGCCSCKVPVHVVWLGTGTHVAFPGTLHRSSFRPVCCSPAAGFRFPPLPAAVSLLLQPPPPSAPLLPLPQLYRCGPRGAALLVSQPTIKPQPNFGRLTLGGGGRGRAWFAAKARQANDGTSGWKVRRAVALQAHQAKSKPSAFSSWPAAVGPLLAAEALRHPPTSETQTLEAAIRRTGLAQCAWLLPRPDRQAQEASKQPSKLEHSSARPARPAASPGLANLLPLPQPSKASPIPRPRALIRSFICTDVREPPSATLSS